MAEAVYEYVGLSTRDGFNRSLRHFLALNDILPDFEGRQNLADTLNSLLDDKSIQANQISPILNALLVGHPKYNYRARSYNLGSRQVGCRGSGPGLLSSGSRADSDQSQK